MTMLGDDELRRRLEYHPVSDATRPIYELNRALALLVGAVWDRVLPPGRELALAHTELEAALMRANQSVACGDERMITGPADVDVATYLDDVIERLEGPTMRRSDPLPPLGGSDRPLGVSTGVGEATALYRAAEVWDALAEPRRERVTPLAAREGDQLAADPPAPLGGSARPSYPTSGAHWRAVEAADVALTPLAARSGDELAQRRREADEADEL